ncbi:hypothetical protein CA54_00990 [Symmachiella macrocystis]|uniref:Uncharacterized protein n=1 Tax=Symmachiella macrocystis TaxID=2527985 RepID=A0A5C6BLD3_9PLAN|nr:hypothetical protein CA54_00990 [Symmachiella macrocystis]
MPLLACFALYSVIGSALADKPPVAPLFKRAAKVFLTSRLKWEISSHDL